MQDYVIRPSDYANLVENISEKNIINTVSGKEYILNNVNDALIDNVTYVAPSRDLIFDMNSTNKIPKYSKDLLVNSVYNRHYIGKLKVADTIARSESLYFSGIYTFFTSESISDEESISCSFEINYNKIKGLPITKENYSSQNKTEFIWFGADTYGGEEETTNSFLDVKDGVDKVSNIWGTYRSVAPMPSLREYCNVTKIQKGYDTTAITVSYRFRVWAAWTSEKVDENVVLCVNNIKLILRADTIDVMETPFSYQEGIIFQEHNYTLETNELFQSEIGDNDEDKLSYQTYKKIIESFDTDRRIISFELLNPVKHEFKDGDVYENGETATRYLDTNDTFTIYDEHNKLIGDFRVLTCNKIWDGAFNMRITAQMLDATE